MRRFKLFHETIYDFDSEVTLGPHRLLIRPREGHDIRIESSTLNITPNAIVKWHRDELDNSVAITRFSTPTRQLKIVSEIVIQHYDEWPLDFLVEDHAVQYPFVYADEERQALSPYLHGGLKEEGLLFDNWLEQFSHDKSIETYSLLSQISKAIGSKNQYRVREEPGVQTPMETLQNSSGSCRDYAWLFMCAARRLGMAARFVSGYLHAPATELDYGSTHAWAEVYLPGAGWKGFDPTSQKIAGSHHIPTAVSLFPDAVPPVSGRFTGRKGEKPALGVRVKVQSI
ncbi:MAG: cysteine protease [Gammaproteobacteria bacterium]|jgi:transglutaminase-like putative cysteine protease|nr:cysteine protease [Gammaproteobacteria bacterium]|tara:strand:+ start:426 stop:1280 length:855 start_codon:yes stop_codon:yes gene_type:complete